VKTVDEYLLNLRARVSEIRERTALPAFRGATTQQRQVLLSFLNRAVQIGDGCGLVGAARLGTPLFVLTRVLYEDMFLIYWVSLTPSNAAEYAESVIWEMARVGLVNLDKGCAKIVSKTTREDHTSEVLPKIRALKTDRKNVEQLAGELGLGAVYDILYRASSPEVHVRPSVCHRPVRIAVSWRLFLL